MYYKLMYACVLLTVTNAFPMPEEDTTEWDEARLSRSHVSGKQNKKQFLLNGPVWHDDMPPYSEGVFDRFGHHLTGNIFTQI